MPVKVRIPSPLRSLSGGKAEVEVEAKTIGELIDALEAHFPGIKERLTEGGRIRRSVNIFVNGKDTRFLREEETPLKDGDEVSIIPAVAGGMLTGPTPFTAGAHPNLKP